MATTVALLEPLKEWFTFMMERSDPRTSSWTLVNHPEHALALTALYLAFVFFGQIVMESRQPFDLKPAIVLYNMFLVAVNAFVVYELVDTMIILKFNWKCNAVVTDPNNEAATRMARAIWVYYVSKFVDFFDTVFFVLRKKKNQITFLHVFHHSTMALIWWMGTRWAPGGQSALSATINGFIHVIMYTYYAPGRNGRARQTLFVVETANITYMIMMITLFSAFYRKTYKKKTDRAAATVNQGDAKSSSSAVQHNTTKVTRRRKAEQ